MSNGVAGSRDPAPGRVGVGDGRVVLRPSPVGRLQHRPSLPLADAALLALHGLPGQSRFVGDT